MDIVTSVASDDDTGSEGGVSRLNYKYGSGGSTVETDGMVEKLRGTVASAHLVANVEKAGGGDVAGGDDSSIVGDDRS